MTREELRGALDIQALIDKLSIELKKCRDGGIGGSSNNEPVKGGQSITTPERAVELAEKIAKLEKDLLFEKQIIQRFLDGLTLNDIEQEIMELRYVRCWDWKNIIGFCGYEKTRTYEIHQNVLRYIEFANCGVQRT